MRSISNEDAAERYREEAGDNGVPANERMDATYPTDDAGKTVISWAENDRENPYNWSSVRPPYYTHKMLVLTWNRARSGWSWRRL
jgi:hypothetical protein